MTAHDAAGDYAVELFDCPSPKAVVVCVHGRGVHREDGEQFFYAVAEHYPDRAFLLVDQNQFDGDTCRLNPLPIALARVQGLLTMAREKHPASPVVILAHSAGCGITARLELDGVGKVIFVAPAVGKESSKLADRYGADVADGKLTISKDGLKKYMSREYVASMQGIVWDNEYRKLLARYRPVYVFESGDEEIVGEDRFALRDLPFTAYKIIPGATHNLHSEALQRFFADLDGLL